MRLDELRSLVAAGTVHTVVVAFTDHLGRMLGKRLDAEFFLDEAAEAGTHACDYLLTTDVDMEPLPGFEVANWDRGYGDVHLVPDLDTVRVAGWAPGSAWVLCDIEGQSAATREVAEVVPRNILRRQIERLAELDVRAEVGCELELYVYDGSARDVAVSAGAVPRPRGWYIEDYHLLQGARHEPLMAGLRQALAASGVPVEGTKGEWGVGQHELNLRHADALEAADRTALAKHVAKEMADGLGQSVTFMAKPTTETAGSGCHVHLSLWRDGRNLFGEGNEVFDRALAGWLAGVADVLLWYAPTVNSAKRYRAGSWAPTRLGWSHDNRTAAFRVVGHRDGRRIECRIPGADTNPYLVLAASLACVADGLERQLAPQPAIDGDSYRAEHLPELAVTLADARAAFATSELARRSFGDRVVDHYVRLADVELAAAAAAVTDWERRRYFEQI